MSETSNNPNPEANSVEYAASAKSTGGGGFNHEDEVAAFYLAQMLIGAFPFGPDRGRVMRIAFQTAADGWHLDDLLLTFGDSNGRCAVSVKSNAQFAADHSAPADFVHDCWEQLLKGPPAQPSDSFALAVAGAPADVLDDFNTLHGLAATSAPDSLDARLKVKGFVDAGKRQMAASFARPGDLIAKYPLNTTTDVARVISKVAVLDFDFPSATSRSRNEALQLCTRALEIPTSDTVSQLWNDLCTIARTFRPTAGTVEIAELISRLRMRHRLAGYPDHRADWTRLRQYTETQLGVAGRWTLAGQLSLIRPEIRQQLNDAAKIASNGADGAIAMLTGRSGDGKSVLAYQWLRAGSPGVWLDARLFESVNGEDPAVAAEKRLGVNHPLSELLGTVTGVHPRLVVDGVGRLFEETSLIAIASMAKRAMEMGWEVAVTCQDDDSPRVAMAFQSAGLAFSLVQVGPLSRAELRDVAVAEPRLRPLLAKADVRRVLARPKYLDAVLRSAAGNLGNEIPGSEKWLGESHLAEWCWRQLVEGVPPQTSRSAAAKQMASKQADAVRDSVGEEEIDPAHLPAIDELIKTGVCRKVGERLIFDHDLVGDWGRERLLLAQSNVATFISQNSRGESPLWLRSLSLWALDVLERQADYSKWISTIRELVAAKEVAAADRVVEGVALSANAVEHLEKAWPELVGGTLIRRLLERFMRSATVPNQNALQLAAKLSRDGKDLMTWAAAELRIPSVSYWPAMLTVTHRHREEVARIAPREAARLAKLWLTSTESNMPLRREAAAIALAAANHVDQILNDRKSRRRWSDGLNDWSLCNEAETDSYKAVLSAIRELPAEVTAFTLHAAGRRQTPKEKNDESGVEYAGAWPDGPVERVSKEFRDAFFDINTFLPFAASVPEVAKEILLAVLIEEPAMLKHPGMHGLSYSEDEDLSIEDVIEWSPAFHSRGPFQVFLNTAPSVAVDAIVRLVNFATERWVDRETRDIHGFRRESGPPKPINVYLSDEQNAVQWLGDIDVYSWYLGDSRAPHVVVSAMMALEKWLYDSIERGEDVTAAIDQIKSTSKSVAFAGMLSAVVRRHPALIAGPLSFLIGTPEFMYWEANPEQNILDSALFAWQLFPVREPHLVEPAREWYAMPHRRVDLFTFAKAFFVRNPGVRDLQNNRLPRWRRELEGELAADSRIAREECVRNFDIGNWEEVEMDGGKALRLRLSPDEIAANNEVLENAQSEIQVISFPHRCRGLLNQTAAMSPADLEQFWETLQRIARRIDGPASPQSDKVGGAKTDPFAADRGALRRRRDFDAVLGGIAVLLLKNAEWLNQHRVRKAWVLRQLRRLLRMNIPHSSLDGAHPDENNDDRWECFFAEIVVGFLRRKPRSPVWRYYAAMILSGFHHSPIRRLMSAAYQYRAELAGGFEELSHLVLRISAVRWHAEHVRNGWTINIDVKSEMDRAIGQFFDGQLTGSLPTFADLAKGLHELPDRPKLPERFRHGIDVPLVAAAFNSILNLKDAHDESERKRWISFWRDFLCWRLTPVSKDDRSENHNNDDGWPRNKLPYRSDRWLLERIAGAIFHMRLEEDPRQFWQPIFDLVPDLKSWTEDFLTSLFLTVFRSDAIPVAFSPLWKEMMDYASSNPSWKNADDEAWAHLLGFDHLFDGLWEMKHESLLRSALPYLDRFLRQKIRSGWKLNELFRLLKAAPAKELSTGLLPAIADAIEQRPDLFRYNGTPAATANFLDFCLRERNAVITTTPQLFDAFKQILGALVALQVPLAFEIQEKLRRA